MNRLLSLVFIATFLWATNSSAAPATIPVKDLRLLATAGSLDEVSGIIPLGSTIVIYGTKQEKSYARSIDASGNELWKIELDSQLNSLASVGTVDSLGNIWIGGSISEAIGNQENTPGAKPINPDNVTTVPEDLDMSLTSVVLWQIDPTTLSVRHYLLKQTQPVLITSIAINQTGLSLVGISPTNKGSAGILITMNSLGEFVVPLQIGISSTTLDAVVRNPDGSMTVTGASAETLKGKKLVGMVDGIIVKISQSNEILSVVRSSASKARRNWSSASSTLLLGGEVITGKVAQAAVTKFSTTYAPQWSNRFTSTGKTLTYGSTYAFLASTGPIPQLTKWAPKSPRPIVLIFDSKGAVVSAYATPINQREVVGLVSNKSLGLLCVSASKDSVSIFALN